MRVRRTIAVASALVTAIALLAIAPGTAAAAPTDVFLSEYIEGSSNNKALEMFNGTGAPVDLAAGGYQIEMYFNGNTTAAGTVALTGTVADGDVYVLAHASANATILAQADQTSSANWFNGDDALVLRKGGAGGTIVDSFGQVGLDPGTEWGTGITSTADNTVRRKASVTTGDTTIADAFDPAVDWYGYPTDTIDGLGAHSIGTGPIDAPAVLVCGAPLVTAAGTAATRVVTATDPDDTITGLDITAVVPIPVAGTITRTAVNPAAGVGATATADITVSATMPAGSYAVTLTATDTDGVGATCELTVQVTAVLTVGEVQGPTLDTENGQTDRSPLAPAAGNGASSTLLDVRGVITQKTLSRTSAGAAQHGFFLQSRLGNTDGDPQSSDGIFVFMGSFTSLIGGYTPTVGDEVVLRARVSEFFSLTQLSSAALVTVIASGLDVATAVEITDAVPPASLADANRYWERHEGARMRVRAGSGATSGRDVFAATADAEIWLVDRDDPLQQRADPYARRVFRDTHPLDNQPATGFDDGNGQRILLGSLGVKAVANDNSVLLPPARVFDTLSADAVGGIYFSFRKYGVQVEAASFTPGPDPSRNAPPATVNRSEEFSVATFNVENLYDFRDDPFDGCDFVGNTGCPGVSPPFDYVPASAEAYNARLAAEAGVIIGPLKTPDILLLQEAEDQDICTVAAATLVCAAVDNADGKPDTLQELALAVAAAGGPAYDAAYDRDGADARGIVAGFLFRTDRVALAPAGTGVQSATPGVTYRSDAVPYNADVQNPKSLNAVLPSDVDTSTGVDGAKVYTRAPQVAHFTVASAPGSAERLDLWAISNHFSSTPDARVGQRREQAAYGAAIISAITAADAGARIVYGGDLNVFPRPDDPIAQSDADPASDQLGPLYGAGMRNLWENLVADAPSAAYSYTFQGQAQTLDHLFVNPALYGDLVQMRAAHIDAGWPADFDGDGARGVSDHDPQVARFRSKSTLSVGNVTVAEGNSGTTPATFPVTLSRPLSQPILICAATLGLTAADPSDYAGLGECRRLPAGTATATFVVSVRGDTMREANEKFALLVLAVPHVRLAKPVGIATITNDD
jgi:predicted extracellular nuclease